MRVLALNAGSSTLKWTLFDGDERRVLDACAEPWASEAFSSRRSQLRAAIGRHAGLDAVGHRVVHGGTRFTGPTVVDAAARAELESLVPLDPLHMRPSLAAIDAVAELLPSVAQVAVFDTAFHAGMPAAAAGYGLPFEWTERWGLRRFGFHGLSVQYALGQAAALLGRVPPRLVVCHLGSGCSLTAVADGASVDTTMGFTPLDGVMMATRSGAVDPGLLLHLQTRCGVGVDELAATLAGRSGLLGVSGVSGDLRAVLGAADGGSARAQLAYHRFVWMLRRALGAMVAVLGGVDAIVFTGGMGEHSARLRRDVCAALTFAGLRLDEPATGGDRTISAAGSAIAVLVVEAREDLIILDGVSRALAAPA